MKIHFKSLLLLAAAGLLAACSLPAVPDDASGRAVASPIQVTVTTNKPVYQYGETVVMTLTAKNVGTQPVKLTFTSGQRFDFVVSYHGMVVWKWSAGKAFPGVMGSLTLNPGQSVTYRTSEYKAVVSWNSITGKTVTLDLTGILTSTPAYSGRTQFGINLITY